MPEETVETKLARIERMANLGLKPAAAQLSRLILEKDPRNVQALVWLARTSTQPDEAERATQQAQLLAADDPLVRDLMTSRQPASVGANPGPTTANPYTANPGGSPFGTYTPGASDFNAPTLDYMQMLNATAVPPTTPVPPVTRPVKASSNRASLLFGLLFLLLGIGLGLYWTLSLLSFNNDAAQPTRPLDGQITKLSSSDLMVDAKGQGSRTYTINNQLFNSLAPLISDSKNNKSLVPNAVTLNLTPADRLASVDVSSPNKGSSANGLQNDACLVSARLSIGP